MHVIAVRRVLPLSRYSGFLGGRITESGGLYRAAAFRTSTLIERDGIGTVWPAAKNLMLGAEAMPSGTSRLVSTPRRQQPSA